MKCCCVLFNLLGPRGFYFMVKIMKDSALYSILGDAGRADGFQIKTFTNTLGMQMKATIDL